MTDSRGEFGPDYATFKNEPLRKYEPNLETKGRGDYTDRSRSDRLEELQSRRKSANILTPSNSFQRGDKTSSPPDLDEIQLKTRMIEEKKRKIDMEIEKRIQEENERRRKLSSQVDYLQKLGEKNEE